GMERGLGTLADFYEGLGNIPAELLERQWEFERAWADNLLSLDGLLYEVEGELPEKLTNNIGCMGKTEIEDFATMVLRECGYSYTMKWTTAGDIVIKPFVYIDESHINEYPYIVKERVLHEVAHIDTWPQDDRHGELFHRKYAELVNRFLAGYKKVRPTKDWVKEG
ncbi:hypothetical protein LCGC14_3022130, partial [marine sediment metagenome]